MLPVASNAQTMLEEGRQTFRYDTGRRRWQGCGRIRKGGFFHAGRFATLLDVVNHYDGHFNLNLSDADKNDLVEYLKGI